MNTDVSSSSACPRCGAPIPAEAPQGLCPRCVLLGAATSTEPAAGATLRPPPDLETIRAAFPQLEILRLIGQGGMGFVYAARQPQLDRLVALKLLPMATGSDPAFAERFAREGRLLARLNHPNIVSVYEFGQAPGFGYLIMEFVDGVNLRQAMRSGRFSPSEALAIVPRICEALQYAHDQGVLHRDIKPENILLDAQGRVKIADFGIAKLAGDRQADVTLTASGARLGTPHYMAPEQIEAPSAVDHRADIYSLGVVFYELLTGEPPLGRFAPPSAKAELDARIDEIVMRALAKERELRQQSAGEVKTQVEGLGEAGPGIRSAGAPHVFDLPRDFEYRSPRTLFGLPLVHVVSGTDPRTGRSREAHGIIAMGPRARGGLAVGGTARGIVAIGGGAFGVFACGGVACGGVAFGGATLGLVSLGGLALAVLLACGGLAVGWNAVGGLAVGIQAVGGLTFSMLPEPALLGWRRALLRVLPWLWIPTMIPAFMPIAITAWALRKQREAH
ncbi:MAG: serine/threonine protein kinase, partial [Verrucomicrobiae bacterium]|nr:serine/threonine protein kinase [Verrucomicrobiae bacterium]